MSIIFVRSRDNVVFSHRVISYDIEDNKCFDVCDLDDIEKHYSKYSWVFLLHDRERVERIQEIRKNIKVACWSLEDPYELDKDFEICRKYDYVFTMDNSAVGIRNRFGFNNIALLPLAVNSKVYYPDRELTDEKYISDILMVGVAFPLRIAVAKGLSDFVQENNLKFRIVGWWWEKLNNKYLEKNCVEKGIFPSDVIKQYYNGAKIVLELNRDLYLTNLKTEATTPGRAFNSLACKRFTISDKRADTSTLFDIEKELITFSSIVDLKEKILYYMDAINERETIEECGYKRVIKEHTIIKRMEFLKEKLRRV
jgi:spore maturation protein CgeB